MPFVFSSILLLKISCVFDDMHQLCCLLLDGYSWEILPHLFYIFDLERDLDIRSL